MYKYNLVGKKFNRLTVVCFSHMKSNSYWKVKCDCGNELTVADNDLKRGRTKSCGCLLLEKVSKHNMCGTPTYNSWANMIQRTTNVNHINYKEYMGRGIDVCNKWLTFEGFYEDMGTKPPNTSIDRVDNDKGYYKENCKWSTMLEQSNNKRSNVNITYKGKTQTLTQCSKELGINRGTLNSRFIHKWPLEKCFEKVK